MIKVLIVDDHAMVREGLRSRLETATGIEIVGEAGNSQDAVSRCKLLKPHVVVLDVKLPDGSGLALIPNLRKAHAAAKVVVLTMYDDVRVAIQAFEMGADAFVIKGASSDELLQAIRDAMRGRSYISIALASQMAAWIRDGKHTPQVDDLSRRERAVLRLIGEGFNMTEVASQLKVSPKTVGTYRGRIMEKLKLNNHIDLVRYARSVNPVDAM